MSLRINTNVDALTAYNALNSTQNSMSNAIEQLSTGLRINKAADDAAGLAISQGMTAEINGLGQAISNAQDGIDFVQTADGALTETQSILQRMRTLSVHAANDTNSSASRTDIQTEITQLNNELDRIASATNFNGIQMLLPDGGGSYASGFNFQVGADSAINGATGASAGTFNDIKVTILSATSATGSTIPSGPPYAAGTTWTVPGSVVSSGPADGVFLDLNGNGSGDAGEPAWGGSVTPADFVTTWNYHYGSGGVDGTYATATLNGDGTISLTSLASSQGLYTTTDTGVTGTPVTPDGTSGSGSSGSGASGFTSTDLGTAGISVASFASATSAISTIDKAISEVSTTRANLGAYQNRFQHAINNLTTEQQNLTSADSDITDTDMASTMVTYTRDSVLQQAGTAMLRQANSETSSVLSLLS